MGLVKALLLDKKGNFTLSDLQEVHKKIQGSQALTLRDLRRMLLRLEYASGKRPMKLLRKKRETNGSISDEDIFRSMTEVVWGAVVVANYFDINLAKEFALNFPAYCRYCTLTPCDCGKLPPEKKPKRTMLEIPPAWWPTKTFQELQAMVWEIYPKPITREGLLELVCYLYEEKDELAFELDCEEVEVSLSSVSQEVCDFLEKSFDIALVLETLSNTPGEFARHVAMRFNYALSKPPKK